MAIYGVNFNGTQIPPGVKRHFSRELKLPGMKRGERALLQGVAQSPSERDLMLVQASNGHRRLHVVDRQTAAGVWYGIYVHWSDGVTPVRATSGSMASLRVLARTRAAQAGLDPDTVDACANAIVARLMDGEAGRFDEVAEDEIRKHANP